MTTAHHRLSPILASRPDHERPDECSTPPRSSNGGGPALAGADGGPGGPGPAIILEDDEMNSLYKSMNRRVPSLDAALSAVLGTALTSTRCPLATALRQVRGARWRGLSVAVLLMGLMGGLGVVDPAFGPSKRTVGVMPVGCLDEKPVYNCKTSAPAVPTGVTVDNNHAGLRVHWDRPAAGTGIVEYIVYRRSGAGSQFAEFAKLTSDALPSYVYFDASFNGVNEYYRCAQSGGVTLPDPWASPSEKPQFLDTFVENGNNYIYRVKARTLREGTATGRSAWSSPSSRNYHQVAMDAPTGLSGSPNANGPSRVDLDRAVIHCQRWDKQPGAPGRTPTSFDVAIPHWLVIKWRTGRNWRDRATSTTQMPTRRPLTDSSSSLAGSTTYIYQVRGVRKHLAPLWRTRPTSLLCGRTGRGPRAAQTSRLPRQSPDRRLRP